MNLFQQTYDWLESAGRLAPLWFVPLYMGGTFVFVPMAVLFLASGALFGVRLGFVLASLASLASAAIVFLIARGLSREWVIGKIASREKLRALEDAVSRGGWKAVLLLRLSVTLPFSVMNYALGLSRIRFRDFMLCSWLGMTPGIFLYVYAGSSAGKLILDPAARQKSPLEWALFGFGLLGTVVLVFYMTALVKKSLTRQIV